MKLAELYRLKHLVRYQNVPHLANESVAEHSFLVALGVLLICEELELDNTERAHLLSAALCHDLPEIQLTDVPHNVKQNFPAIDAAVKVAEEQVWRNQLSALAKFTELTEKQYCILKLADALSVVMYSQAECALGNKHNFDRILQESEDICERLAAKLGIRYDDL